MKNCMRVITICFVFIFLFGSISFAANNKVGYINLQRLVNESKMGKSAREDILKMRREKEKAVAAKQNQINRLRNEINTKAAFPCLLRKNKTRSRRSRSCTRTISGWWLMPKKISAGRTVNWWP